MLKDFEREALLYHSNGKPGKVDVRSSKPCANEYDLSLAYSPGVAAPCIEIAKDPSAADKYTTRNNLVAVITNGSAVLGLGNIGPLASKPVMEGKGVLFKQFAGIDVFDLEINAETSEEFIAAVQTLEPTFGGINLEDIKAPECFVIEKTLKERMNIPVFHDDQHGTAIISAAALLNACIITKRKLKKIKIVFNGAGAAAQACAKLMIKMGVQPKNLIMCDSRGVLYEGRSEGMNEYKEYFTVKTNARNLKDALVGADVFCGLSVANVLSPDMLMGMAKNPIVFAMANPEPEINPELAKKTRADVIIATGRSDFPNQVNNVLGFPYIFRGALDVQASEINDEMKMAAVNALAELAREEVPENVSELYEHKAFHFGPEYIIPKPLDPRVLMNVAPAVAKAAIDTGIAAKPIKNFKAYREKLEALNSISRGFIRLRINTIKKIIRKNENKLPIIIFPEGQSTKVLKALNTIHKEKIITPILLGYEDIIRKKMTDLDIEELVDVKIIKPALYSKYDLYVKELYKMRNRKGVSESEAEKLIANPYYFSAMAVQLGDADGLIAGSSSNYAECVKPILQIIGTRENTTASGINIVLFEGKIIFFADTTVNINPTAEQLAKIAINAAQVAKMFKVKPRIAMLSYSNFVGKKGTPAKMQEASKIVKKLAPDLIVDGEMPASNNSWKLIQ